MEDTMLNTSQHISGITSQFKFELLKQITNNFSEDRKIGHGAFGVVYQGVMDNGLKIAVKILLYRPPDQDVEKQFQNECTNLMRVQHPNIVRLVGYCYETHHECVEYGGKYVFAGKNERVLCFEYLEGGSLEKYVNDKPCILDWDKCYTIIKGVCNGLNHLHEYSIFHLDIKPANILLDNSMTPKIGDFGLSRLFSSTETCTTTTPLGTPGYTPPEYINNRKISEKYDVFSLGVVIIHIMAGRETYNDHFDTPSKIIDLVCENWQKRLPVAMRSHEAQQVKTCIEIAMRCVKSNRQDRPTIRNIIDDLNKIDAGKSPLIHEAAKLESMEASDYNQYTGSVSMGMHGNTTGFDSVEGIDNMRAMSDEEGSNDRSMHKPMDCGHESNDLIMREMASGAIEWHGSGAISEPRVVTQTAEVDNLSDGHHWRNPHLSGEENLAEGNFDSPITMNTIRNLFHWARSTIPSQWSGTQEKMIHDELFLLESSLQHLLDTLPAMYDLIDRAEWRIHKHRVAGYLPKLKDVVYDADDLLDEFRWYTLKVKVEGNGSQSSSMDFFDRVIQGSFSKLLNGIQNRLDNISNHLLNMGLRELTTRFDKSVRPETSYHLTDAKIFGRDMELNKIVEFLCEPSNNGKDTPKRQKGNNAVDVSTSTSTSYQVYNESSITNIHVLPIVGIGGVGKTTLVQHICSYAQVKSHFNQIIWVCVSDDFDVKRLTKEAIECTRIQATGENLNNLQNILSDNVSGKKLLIVLDDMWDDVLKENGQRWKRFCAPLKNVLQGSVMLVTTRSPRVADRVGTTDPIILEGLRDEVFWNFFKLCAFGSGSSIIDQSELESIGRNIAPKLKGSPLAAKTLGRILRKNLQTEHWNDILNSEIWKLRQDETEILPALRLSYMYLPFHLKKCFSFSAVYPKNYEFQKDHLAEIWVAEGFVKPQDYITVQDTACHYFHELLYLSFFQNVRSGYVIHDLLHDMAQKVSEDDCFILRRKGDFESIPLNVRHLSILSGIDIDYSNLLGIRRFTKLRTLLCYKSLATKEIPGYLMEAWCGEFRRLRVIVFSSIHELPASIGNLKHLRYLQISRACLFKSLPTEFCWLYNLQTLYVQQCNLETLPTDFSKLICLERFESHRFRYSLSRRFVGEEFCYKVLVDVDNGEKGLSLIGNINQISELKVYNIGKPISKMHAAEAQLQNKKYLEVLNLQWSLLRNPEDSDIEVLRYLQPPTCLKSLLLDGYRGVSLPRWFQRQNCTSLMSPSFISSARPESSLAPRITDLIINRCENLSNLELVIHPAYVPALKKMVLKNCKNLVSVPAERFGDLHCLKELEVWGCPNIYSQRLVTPSLKRLMLGSKYNDLSAMADPLQNVEGPTCGNLAENIECFSLTYFFLSCNYLTSIRLHKWNLPALKELHVSGCQSLTSIIRQSGQVIIRGNVSVNAFPSLTSLTIGKCTRLPNIDDLLAEECLPAIERIHLKDCPKLVSLPGEKFGSFSSLKELVISDCGSLSWSGFVLPSSLQILSLHNCGDISPWFPSCLENLASLVSLKIHACRHIKSIPGKLWSTNLRSLEELIIWSCEDIVSIGGENTIAKIRNVSIIGCPRFTELQQPMRRSIMMWDPFMSNNFFNEFLTTHWGENPELLG